MRPFSPILPLLLLAACGAPGHLQPGSSLEYPQTATVDHLDVYHGVTVADPYRWLEDADSAETAAWVREQNAVTDAYLDRLTGRSAIRARLTELWNYERSGVPVAEGGRLFTTRNDGLQDQSILYVQDAPDAAPRVLLDPNTLSDDGTVALAEWEVSPDGEWMAYALSSGGSDWREWRVREVATATDLPDRLEWSKFSGAAWAPDSSGFWYSRYPAPEGDELTAANRDQKLWFHRRGTPQSEDVIAYERPEHPKWGFGAEVSEDGRYLVISGWEGTERKNRVWYRDLQGGAEVVGLFTDFDASYEVVGNEGSTWFVFTTRDAPRGRVIAVDLASPQPAAWRDVVPQGEDALTEVAFVGGALVCHFLHDASSRLLVVETDGRLRHEVALPALGTAGGIRGAAEGDRAWFAFSSFTYPSSVLELDLDSGAVAPHFRPAVDFEPADYRVEQVWYASPDGTRVPMFLVARRDAPRGPKPVQLYGYGGFNIPITPSFSVANLVWLEMGGVLAVANIRGGGEFGRDWHQAGTVHRKQNVFDDFIAAGEWLVANGWTTPAQLAIRGGSNGGLLVGACVNQRPDLFGAALPAVGVMDMLRFHRFTIGWAWTSDYGSSEDTEQFRTLLAYSPYHNIRPGVRYPAVMVTTGDHDDRVVPAHSFKYAAALQKAQGGPEPVLIRIETRGGHGAGKPTSMRIAEYADMWAFLQEELGMPAPRF